VPEKRAQDDGAEGDEKTQYLVDPIHGALRDRPLKRTRENPRASAGRVECRR
jgi:hypothetical protein